jgi:hypothetical protein
MNFTTSFDEVFAMFLFPMTVISEKILLVTVVFMNCDKREFLYWQKTICNCAIIHDMPSAVDY